MRLKRDPIDNQIDFIYRPFESIAKMELFTLKNCLDIKVSVYSMYSFLPHYFGFDKTLEAILRN